MKVNDFTFGGIKTISQRLNKRLNPFELLVT